MEDAFNAADQPSAPMSSLIEISPMRCSSSLGKLVEAMAKAQLEFRPVVKEASNEAFKRGNRVSKYATLDSAISATQEALAKHGIVVFQVCNTNTMEKTVTVTTRLVHSSSEWVEGGLTMPMAQQGFTVHGIGSAITYGRRYSYMAMIGVAPEDEDDGNLASGVGSKEAQNVVAREKVGQKAVPALFYVWHDESQTAEISGAEEILKSNRDVLKPLYNGGTKTIVANAEQLENLKFSLEQRGVIFKPLKANGEAQA